MKVFELGIGIGIGIGWTKKCSIGIGIGIGKNNTDPPSLNYIKTRSFWS